MEEHVQMIVDCASGKVQLVPLSAHEVAARAQQAAVDAHEAAAERQTQQQRQADLATVQAYAAGTPDPHWQALARLLQA